MSININELDKLLKTMCAGEAPTRWSYDQNARPFYTRLKKNTSFAGSFMAIPQDDGSTYVAEISQHYTTARITGEYLLRSMSDKHSFIDGLKNCIDSKIKDLANTIEESLYTKKVEENDMSGLEEWITTEVDGNKDQIRDSIVTGAVRLGENGARPDAAFMSYTNYHKLQQEGGEEFPEGHIKIMGPNGPIECVPAPHCQKDTVWLLTFNTWQMISMGDPIRMLNYEGPVLRATEADTYEVRIGSFSSLVCNKPSANCRINLGSQKIEKIKEFKEFLLEMKKDLKEGYNISMLDIIDKFDEIFEKEKS